MGTAMHRIAYVLPMLLTPYPSSGALPRPPQYINSHALILSFQPASPVEIDDVHVWVCADDRKAWTKANIVRTGETAVRFQAPQDGKYSFYIVLENEGGCSTDVPAIGTEPHATAVVDTTPPTMQIHKAREITLPDGDPCVRLNVSLVEENLGEAGARLFHRANSDDGWQDGGIAIFADGIINWRPPPEIPSEFDLRLAVTDLAGNRAFDEIRGVSIDRPAADAAPPAASVDPTAAETAPPDVVENVVIHSLAPVTVAPAPPVTIADQPAPPPATQPLRNADEHSQRLREQAARYLAQGHFSLAGARLLEALELAPEDPDLQVDLGSVLYRTHQYEEARRRFRSALDLSPDHLGAIEGLALVAATQNRYPQARSHLQHLLRLSPQSGEHWLHYGDIEHLLGNAAEAGTAWEKVLTLERADKTIRENAKKRLRLFGQQSPSSD